MGNILVFHKFPLRIGALSFNMPASIRILSIITPLPPLNLKRGNFGKTYLLPLRIRIFSLNIPL